MSHDIQYLKKTNRNNRSSLQRMIRLLPFLIIIVLMMISFNACNKHVKDTPNSKEIKTEEFNMKYEGVSRFEDSIYVSVFIYNPYQKSIYIDPEKDFALIADGKELPLVSVNDDPDYDQLKIVGVLDDRIQFEYKFKDMPEEMKFQVRENKKFKDNVQQWNLNADLIN